MEMEERNKKGQDQMTTMNSRIDTQSGHRNCFDENIAENV